jgi:hypothetical protein
VCYVFRVVFVSTILRLDCGFVLTVLYFLFCIFYYERTWSKLPTLTYNWVSSLVIKNALILNFINNIFNLRSTKIVMRIILVLLKRADGIDHHLHFR